MPPRPTSSSYNQRHRSSAAVPRHTVFVLNDGTVVVQWDERRVQALISGAFLDYHGRHDGRPVLDSDLARMKALGCVDHFDRQFVWLYALPEGGRFDQLRTQEHSLSRVRRYYLTTMLPASELDALHGLLHDVGLMECYVPRAVEDELAIFGKGGAPFRGLKDAEKAARELAQIAPDALGTVAVAFMEIEREPAQMDLESDTGTLDLNALIASQDEQAVFVGKRALIVCPVDECACAIQVLTEFGVAFQIATTAIEALRLMEEGHPDLLVMDLHLPDMHGWQMLGKAREMERTGGMRVIALADENSDDGDQAFALTVARVDSLLTKPLGASRLRRSVWAALKANPQ
ncbi:MAG: response regulator [Chloroflexota bacterium]|nr:response regulator [Chloroflexota bacterium]